MALPFTTDSLDAIPEAQRSLYKDVGGKFTLDVDGYEDPVNLKTALQKERKAASDALKQANAWTSLGKTPDEIQSLLAAQQQADQDKALKNGEYEKLKSQMLTQHQAELATKDKAVGTMRGQLERYLIEAAAVEEIAKAKGVPALLLPHVKAATKVIEESGDYVVRVVDAGGNPRVNGKGEFLSIADLVGEMRQSDVYGRAFDATGTTGSGTQPSSAAGGKKTIKQEAFDAMRPKERAKAMSDGLVVVP